MVSALRSFLNHPAHYPILILPFFLFALTLPITVGLILAQATMPQSNSQTLGVMTYETRASTSAKQIPVDNMRKPAVLDCSMCGDGSLCLDQNNKRALCVPSSYASRAAAMTNVTCISCAKPTSVPSLYPSPKNCRYVEVQCVKAPCPKQYICN